MSEVNCISGGILRQAAKLCAKQDARTLKLLTSNNSSDMLTPWPRHKCKFTSPLGTDYTTIIFWLPHPRDDRNAFPTLHPRASSSLSNPKDPSKATAQLLRHFFLPSSPSFIPALLTRDLASIQRQQETPPPPQAGPVCQEGPYWDRHPPEPSSSRPGGTAELEARATRTPRHWAALPLTPHHPPTPPRPTRRHRQGRDGLTGGATPVPSRGSAEGRTAGRGPTAEGKQHPAPSRLLIGQNDPPNTHPPLTSPPLY